MNEVHAVLPNDIDDPAAPSGGKNPLGNGLAMVERKVWPLSTDDTRSVLRLNAVWMTCVLTIAIGSK